MKTNPEIQEDIHLLNILKEKLELEESVKDDTKNILERDRRRPYWISDEEYEEYKKLSFEESLAYLRGRRFNF